MALDIVNFDANFLSAISTMSGDYTQHKSDRQLIEDLLAGTSTMRSKGTTYLPMEEGETVQSYNNRLNRSFLTNFYEHTLDKLSSEVFSKDVTFKEIPGERQKKATETLSEACKNIDFKGNNITTFGKENFSNGLAYGSSIIHVNFPYIEGHQIINGSAYYKNSMGKIKPIDEQAEKKNNWRPYFVNLPVTHVLRSTEEIINGVNVLTGIVLKDKVAYENPIYDDFVDRIQYLYMENGTCKFVVWQQKKAEDGWDIVSEGDTLLPEIPMAIFSPGKEINLILSRLPLQTLAELNLMHYQSDSQQRNILHYARLITFFGKGLDAAMNDERILVGANQIVHSDSEFGDFKVVEHSGSGIEAGRKDIETLEEKMAIYGLSLLLPKTDRSTATEKLIDTSESDSILKSYALMYQNTLENAFRIYSSYYKGEVRRDENFVVPIINTDLKSIYSTESLNYIVRGVQEDIVSRSIAAKEYKRRNIISKEVNVKDMMEEIDAYNKRNNEYKNLNKINKINNSNSTQSQDDDKNDKVKEVKKDE